MHVAAYQNGLAKSMWEAVSNNICDFSWKLDFGKLYKFAGGTKQDVRRAVLYGSEPPKNELVWEAAKREGFEVVTYSRNVANHEKKIDTDIVATMIEDSFTILQPGDEVTLLSGDSDYVPAVNKITKRGIKVNVIFWKHASNDLKESATCFVELDRYLNFLACS